MSNYIRYNMWDKNAYWFTIFNCAAVEADLVTWGSKASEAKVLTYFSQSILSSEYGKLIMSSVLRMWQTGHSQSEHDYDRPNLFHFDIKFDISILQQPTIPQTQLSFAIPTSNIYLPLYVYPVRICVNVHI